MRIKILFSFLLFLLLSFSHIIHGQIQKPGLPPSFEAPRLKSSTALPEMSLKKLNIERLLKEDEEFPLPVRYSIHEEIDINLKDVGTMTPLKKGKIWRYNIQGQNAKSLNIVFKNYRVPEGAELYIYNLNEKIVYGAFTEINNKPFRQLAIADFPSNECTIEYFEPDEVDFPGELIIGTIGKGYRDPENILFQAEENPMASQIDINCQEGDDYQLEKHAVCRITFRRDGAGFICSGALINNTAFNGIPYFLTANHCISKDSVAETVVAYFNYESVQCDLDSVLFFNKTLSGAMLRTTRSVSDVTLLELNEVPDESYKPYYAGWNVKDTAPSRSYSIHHPNGATKKLSVEIDSAISYPNQLIWKGEHLIPNQQLSPANTHWQVIFDIGEMEGGSSGAPLFNEDDKIVGQLHGGINGAHYFGKLSESWEIPLNDELLKPWLDPLDSGFVELEGYFPDDITPDAHFSISLHKACANTPVIFKDKSAFNPSSWKWNVSPNTFSFGGETNENAHNAVIIFEEPGTYSISLEASNKAGQDTQMIENFIVTENEIEIDYLVSARQNICLSDFSDYEIYASGADTFKWKLLSDEFSEFIDLTTNKNIAILETKNEHAIDTTFHTSVLLVGQHGSCYDSTIIEMEIIYPFNDFIENAYPLSMGQNGPFSNECATIQQNEPIPPYGDCNSQIRWCDEYRDGTRIVENSLWFTLTGPSSEIISIETDGFNNQIALYEADHYKELISGNLFEYRIVAANDDYLDEDNSATITNAEVIPGKKYWLQVDGYSGKEDIFTITLNDEPITSDIQKTALQGKFKIYTIPSINKIMIEPGENYNQINNPVLVSVTSVSGMTVYQQKIYQGFSNGIKINSEDFPKGVYIVQVYDNNLYRNQKIVVE